MKVNYNTAGKSTGIAGAGTVEASERAFSKCEFATEATCTLISTTIVTNKRLLNGENKNIDVLNKTPPLLQHHFVIKRWKRHKQEN